VSGGCEHDEPSEGDDQGLAFRAILSRRSCSRWDLSAICLGELVGEEVAHPQVDAMSRHRLAVAVGSLRGRELGQHLLAGKELLVLGIRDQHRSGDLVHDVVEVYRLTSVSRSNGDVLPYRLAKSSEAKNRRVEVGAVVFEVAWFVSTSLELVARSSTVQSLGSELGGRTVSCTNPGCGQHS
jgi:hypothetical protein